MKKSEYEDVDTKCDENRKAKKTSNCSTCEERALASYKL